MLLVDGGRWWGRVALGGDVAGGGPGWGQASGLGEPGRGEGAQWTLWVSPHGSLGSEPGAERS